MRDLGADFEYYRAIEFDKFAVKSYNAIHGTDITTQDIRDVHGLDLGIMDKDKYCYMLTYSFPCQDLSCAGKQKGMSKGDNTRSGLLWEVERLLKETAELPDVLIMENVPQVHGKKNMSDFQQWIDFLESCGYSNYWQDLNAKNYGVAQNRNRCFMVSILGDYSFEFPRTIPLTRKLKSYLEDKVDDRYYITNEKAQNLIQQLIDRGLLANTKLSGGKLTEDGKICVDGSIKNPNLKEEANVILARYDKGICNVQSEGTMVVENSDSAQRERERVNCALTEQSTVQKNEKSQTASLQKTTESSLSDLSGTWLLNQKHIDRPTDVASTIMSVLTKGLGSGVIMTNGVIEKIE